MKNIFLATIIVFLNLSFFAQNQEHKVVFQLVNGDTLSQYGLMKNLNNLTEGWTELQIEVVCHGPGLKLLHVKKSQYLEKVKMFTEKGVDFVACRNTMKAKNVPDQMILQSARRVDMGIKEIITKQEDGWSYIKAGIVRQ